MSIVISDIWKQIYFFLSLKQSCNSSLKYHPFDKLMIVSYKVIKSVQEWIEVIIKTSSFHKVNFTGVICLLLSIQTMAYRCTGTFELGEW